MDLHDSPEDAAFRAEARGLARGQPHRGIRRSPGPRPGRAAARGPRGSAWPGSASSGRTAGPVWAGPPSTAAGAPPCRSRSSGTRSTSGPTPPPACNVMGEGLLGPTLIAYGTEDQKNRFLNPIRWGVELWCQGYSEPDAGSDLANVQTKAVLDGRRVGHHRPEGVDLLRPVGGLVLRGLPHRSRGASGTRGSPTFSSPWTSPASRSGPSGR